MAATEQNWTITGEYVDFCNCSVPCQCLWQENPDDDICTSGWFWNIEEGSYGDVSLDGLTAGFLADEEGVLFEGGWDVVLVLDEAANEDQADALETIFLGQAGGLFGAVTPMIDEVVDIVSLPLKYSRENGRLEFEGGGILSMEGEIRHGLHEEEGTVFPHPFIPPDQEAILGKSTEAFIDFNDQFSWDLGGNNVFIGDFDFGSA